MLPPLVSNDFNSLSMVSINVHTALTVDVVLLCRHFYKQKRYPEALEKCEAALAILYDPQLQAMVDKIKSKIEAGL